MLAYIEHYVENQCKVDREFLVDDVLDYLASLAIAFTDATGRDQFFKPASDVYHDPDRNIELLSVVLACSNKLLEQGKHILAWVPYNDDGVVINQEERQQILSVVY